MVQVDVYETEFGVTICNGGGSLRDKDVTLCVVVVLCVYDFWIFGFVDVVVDDEFKDWRIFFFLRNKKWIILTSAVKPLQHKMYQSIEIRDISSDYSLRGRFSRSFGNTFNKRHLKYWNKGHFSKAPKATIFNHRGYVN